MTTLDTLRSTARSGARAVISAVGQASAPLRMDPTFIIAGAQRCGTTSLYRMLAAHPDMVAPALNKGIHYFDTANRFRRGQKFYSGHFPLRRPGTGTSFTGEGSPYYLFHPLAMTRIAAAYPEVKAIVLLRDPVERAYSAYKQEKSRGFETLGFAEALAAEPGRLRGEEERIVADPSYQSFSHQHHAYVARGHYAGQIARAFDALGRDHVLILDADDFLSSELSQWHLLTEFLGISPWRPAQVLQSNARPSERMDEQQRAWLEEQFTDDNTELIALLGYVPSWLR